MVNYAELSFRRLFSHVEAHQDDNVAFQELSRPSQLNCGCDAKAKTAIHTAQPGSLPANRSFPLEPVSVFVDGEKMTSDTGPRIRFWAQRQLAQAFFSSRNILQPDEFEEVDWDCVYAALHKLPRLFGIWACKQVMDIAGTNVNQAKYKRDHCASALAVVSAQRHTRMC